jgi:hypothetical protein
MPRIRLVLIGLAVVLAVSALASATASASTEFVGAQCLPRADGHGHWKDSKCSEPGTNVPYETDEITNSPVEGEGVTAVLKVEIGTTKIYIDCQKTAFTGRLEKGNKSSATLTYKECKLYEEATGKSVPSCTVEDITASVVGKIIGSKGALEEEFTPKENEEFTKIKISGASCVLKGTFEIKGSQKCGLPDAESQLVTHTIECKESGSSLKLGSRPATYRSTIIIIIIVVHDTWWIIIIFQ